MKKILVASFILASSAITFSQALPNNNDFKSQYSKIKPEEQKEDYAQNGKTRGKRDLKDDAIKYVATKVFEWVVEKGNEHNNKDRSKESENWTDTYDRVQEEKSFGGLMR